MQFPFGWAQSAGGGTMEGNGVGDGLRHDAALQHRQRAAPAVPDRRHQLRRRRGARRSARVPEGLAHCRDATALSACSEHACCES